jgi:hypothetical protein
MTGMEEIGRKNIDIFRREKSNWADLRMNHRKGQEQKAFGNLSPWKVVL